MSMPYSLPLDWVKFLLQAFICCWPLSTEEKQTLAVEECWVVSLLLVLQSPPCRGWSRKEIIVNYILTNQLYHMLMFYPSSCSFQKHDWGQINIVYNNNLRFIHKSTARKLFVAAFITSYLQHVVTITLKNTKSLIQKTLVSQSLLLTSVS